MQVYCVRFFKKGDSGGPLYLIENKRHVVTGVASYSGCAHELKPGQTALTYILIFFKSSLNFILLYLMLLFI
jgi:hypothetical protein